MKRCILLALAICLLALPLTPILSPGTAVAANDDLDWIEDEIHYTPYVGDVFILAPKVVNENSAVDLQVKAVFGYSQEAQDAWIYDVSDPSDWPQEDQSYESQAIEWASFANWDEDIPFETPLLEPVVETTLVDYSAVELPFLLETDLDAAAGQYSVPYVVFYRQWTDVDGDGECDLGDDYGSWYHMSRLTTINLEPKRGQDPFVNVVDTIIWVDNNENRQLDWVEEEDDANENGFMDTGEGEVRGSVDPGESFYVSLKVRNDGSYAARNIMVKLAYEEARTAGAVSDDLLQMLSELIGIDLSSVLGSSEDSSEYQDEMPFMPIRDSVDWIQTLVPGQDDYVDFPLKVQDTAQSTQYKVPVSLLFQDESGFDEPVVENMIGIDVQGRARFEIAGITTDPTRIHEGDRYSIEIQLENIGSKAAQSVRVGLSVNGEEAIQEQYLGGIEPGSIGIAIFDVEAGSEGLTTLELKINYLQETEEGMVSASDLGEVTERKVEIEILSEPAISSLTWGIIALVIIVIAILIIVILRRRSKGKDKEEEDWGGGPPNSLWGDGGSQDMGWAAPTGGENAGSQTDVMASYSGENVGEQGAMASVASIVGSPADEAKGERYEAEVAVMERASALEEVMEDGRLAMAVGRPVNETEMAANGTELSELEESTVVEEAHKEAVVEVGAPLSESEMETYSSEAPVVAETADSMVVGEHVKGRLEQLEETPKRSRIRRGFSRVAHWIKDMRPFIIRWENVPWSHEEKEPEIEAQKKDAVDWFPNSRIGEIARERLQRLEMEADSSEHKVAAG